MKDNKKLISYEELREEGSGKEIPFLSFHDEQILTQEEKTNVLSKLEIGGYAPIASISLNDNTLPIDENRNVNIELVNAATKVNEIVLHGEEDSSKYTKVDTVRTAKLENLIVPLNDFYFYTDDYKEFTSLHNCLVELTAISRNTASSSGSASCSVKVNGNVVVTAEGVLVVVVLDKKLYMEKF